jgi:hypothetical protein
MPLQTPHTVAVAAAGFCLNGSCPAAHLHLWAPPHSLPLHCRNMQLLSHAPSFPYFPRCSHAIVSSSVGPEYYVTIMSFVDKSQLEPGCSILLHNKASVALACPRWAFLK